MSASMTRRHFVEIAVTLRGLRPEGDGAEGSRELAAWDEIARAFAGMCARSNPMFDRDRFYRAAGVE